LLQLAGEVASSRRLHAEGLIAGPPGQLDDAAVMTRVRALRDRFAAGPIRATDKMGERFIHAPARFIGPDRVEIDGVTHSADAILVATGTQPFVPPDWPALGARLVTSDSLFDLPSIPARIGVIGAGAIGSEIGQAFAMLGAEVHLFGRDQRLAGIDDSAIN